MGCSGIHVLAGLIMMISAAVYVKAVLSPDVTVTTNLVYIKESTTMTCSTSDTVNELEWLFSNDEETDSNRATLIFKYKTSGTPITPGATINATRFEFTGPGVGGDYPLVIKSVEYADDGKYWCRILTSSFSLKENNSTLPVYTPPSSEKMKVGDKRDDETVTVPTDTERPLSCVLYGIRPAATVMSWSVSDSTVTFSNEVISSYQNADDSKLFDSNLTATFSFPASPLSMELSCITPDRQVGPSTGNVIITITLNVTDPCQENPCENGGTCVNENGMPSCNCAGEFTGDTCSEKGGAGSVLYRLDVILACLAVTAVYMFNHGI